MRTQSDAENQGCAAAGTGDAQRLAIADAGWDLHFDGARTAALVERDTALRARKGLFHGDIQVTRIRLGRRRSCCTAKKAREKITEAIEIGKPLAAGVPDTLQPIRRRSKLLTRAV